MTRFTFKRDADGGEAIHVGETCVAQLGGADAPRCLYTPMVHVDGVTDTIILAAIKRADEAGFWDPDDDDGDDEVIVDVPTPGDEPRWCFIEGQTPRVEPCPKCGGRVFAHPRSFCDAERCVEYGEANVSCEFLACSFTYMCPSVLARAAAAPRVQVACDDAGAADQGLRASALIVEGS